MKVKILPILAIIGLFFAIFIAIKQRPDTSKIAPVRNPSEIENTDSNKKIISATGIVESVSEEIQVSPNLSGVVAEVFVAADATVKKDDNLFLIDDRASKARLEIAKSQVEVAKAQVETAQSKFDFYENVKNKAAIAKEEYINRKNQLLETQAKLMEAQAKLKEAEVDLDLHMVKSPIDGKILKVNVRKGEIASIATIDSKYMILASEETYNVRAQIDEYNILDLKQNPTAMIIPRSNSEIKMPASFVRIEPMVEAKRNLSGAAKELVDTRVLEVIFKIEEKNPQVFIGQQVDVYIENTK